MERSLHLTALAKTRPDVLQSLTHFISTYRVTYQFSMDFFLLDQHSMFSYLGKILKWSCIATNRFFTVYLGFKRLFVDFVFKKIIT